MVIRAGNYLNLMVAFRSANRPPEPFAWNPGCLPFGQQPLHVGDRLTLPMAGEVLERTESYAAHFVHVERSSKMIDFVLKYPGVPSGSANDFWLPLGIETFHSHFSRAGDQGHQAGQAQAALEKLDFGGR